MTTKETCDRDMETIVEQMTAWWFDELGMAILRRDADRILMLDAAIGRAAAVMHERTTEIRNEVIDYICRNFAD